jgi:hypothetical protein
MWDAKKLKAANNSDVDAIIRPHYRHGYSIRYGARDADGIVIVPREDASRVIELADEHLANELTRLEQVRSGKSVTEVFGLAPKLAVWEREDH